jgi:hypothetical protein
VKLTVNVENVNVSVFTTDLDVVNAPENRKFPADDASHTEMCEIVSVAVIVNTGEFDKAIEPADAAENVADCLVVTAEALDAADAPGSPICSLMNVPAGAVNAVPLSMFSHWLARVVAASPTVMIVLLS